jgi:hypothetical protein
LNTVEPSGTAQAYRTSAIERELAKLAELDLEGLRSAWRVRVGQAPKLRSKSLLRQLLAWDIQIAALGGVDTPLRDALRRSGSRVRPEVAQPGARITREWKGKMIEVEAVAGGFLWEDRRYRSLSEIARGVTGTRWNGPRFFGLRDVGGGA